MHLGLERSSKCVRWHLYVGIWLDLFDLELTSDKRDSDLDKACYRCRFVAQVSNLLYRRLPAGFALNNRGLCGLEIRDTADWKSALQHCGLNWNFASLIPCPQKLKTPALIVSVTN